MSLHVGEETSLLPLSPRKVDNDSGARSVRRNSTGYAILALLVSVWSTEALFGAFAACHYLRSYIVLKPTDVKEWWDQTDYRLYRGESAANVIMAGHMIGGVFLMLVGPFQFLAVVRRTNTIWHRWIGRLYLGAALLSSISATIWTLVWRTSRCNIHEDLGNMILGFAVFLCTLQTFRYIRARQIQLHRLWAWRLYACVLGAPLYRLYVAIYGGLVIYTSWKGSLWIENGLFYTLVIPNLLVVELLRWRTGQQEVEVIWPEEQDKTQATLKESFMGILIRHSVFIWLIVVFLAVTTSMIGASVWLPAIFQFETSSVTEQLYHDYC